MTNQLQSYESISDVMPPQNLVSPPNAQTETTILLVWNKAEDYTGSTSYLIFRDGNLIGQTKHVFYTARGLKPDTPYHFTVKARLGSRESEDSNLCVARTKPVAALFSITDYGAVGDGKTMNTWAIQRAIDACTPGGKVVIPEGEFLTGALTLKSNMTLYIAAGGKLKGSSDQADYLPLVPNNFAGRRDTHRSLLNGGIRDGEGIADVAIIGDGAIIGGGEALRLSETAAYGDLSRGHNISLMNCSRIFIHGLSISGSPGWNIHPYICHDLTIEGVDIDTKYMYNGDGIDIDSCYHCYVLNSNFNTGDDSIVLKSGMNQEGVLLGKPTHDVHIAGCTFGLSGSSYSRGPWNSCSAFVCGSDMSGGIYNVLVEDCVANSTNSLVCFRSRKERGGYVKNIVVRDIQMWGYSSKVVWFYGNYHDFPGASTGLPAPDIHHITIRNVTGGHSVAAIQMDGLPEKAYHHIAFENLTLNCDQAVSIQHAEEVDFRNCRFYCGGPVYQAEHCSGIRVDGENLGVGDR